MRLAVLTSFLLTSLAFAAPAARPDGGVDGGLGAASDAGGPLDGGSPAAAALSVDEEARLLAGLAPPDAGPAAFATHGAALTKAWTALDTKRLEPMRRWAKAELWPRIDASRPLVYFFGGPDLITADVLYPDAPTLVLCGLERPGVHPALRTLKPAEIEASLASLRTTLRTTVDVSYFITSQMGGDMSTSAYKGVLPVLLFFLARNQEQVLSIDAVTIDGEGALVTLPSPPLDGVSGWRITFRRDAQAKVRELVYLRLDLSNPVAAKTPGFFRYLEGLGPANSLLKAASFILHDRGFSIARDHLLEHSASILEDDSGVPFKLLSTPQWSLTLFGSYSPPRETFKNHLQPDMAKAFEKAAPKPLPFDTGYKHVAKGSHLVLAVKAAPDAGVER